MPLHWRVCIPCTTLFLQQSQGQSPASICATCFWCWPHCLWVAMLASNPHPLFIEANRSWTEPGRVQELEWWTLSCAVCVWSKPWSQKRSGKRWIKREVKLGCHWNESGHSSFWCCQTYSSLNHTDHLKSPPICLPLFVDLLQSIWAAAAINPDWVINWSC